MAPREYLEKRLDSDITLLATLIELPVKFFRHPLPFCRLF